MTEMRFLKASVQDLRTNSKGFEEGFTEILNSKNISDSDKLDWLLRYTKDLLEDHTDLINALVYYRINETLK